MPSFKNAGTVPLYGILGVYLPLSVLVLWMNLIGILLRYLAPPDFIITPFNETIWCFTGFLSALAASCYAGVMKKSHLRHTAADFRGSIFVLAAAYLLVSLLRHDTLLERRFFPCTDSVMSSLAALFAWYSAIYLREIFNGIEMFESFKAQYRGEQLREVMREFSPEISQTDDKLKSLMWSYGIQFILPCLITPGLLFSTAGSSLHSVILTVIVFMFFSAGFLILGFLRLLRRELTYASEGISLAIRDRVMPIPVMGLGIGIAAILAAGASSETSLLPPRIILGFLAWLGRLLSSLIRPADQTDLFPPGRGDMLPRMNIADMLPDAGETGPWEGWKYVKYGFMALLAFLFLLFMVYPLLKRSGFSLNASKVLVAMRKWLRDLKRSFFSFFTILLDRGNSGKFRPDEEKLRRIASELLSGGTKRKELKRSVNLFARLILWGIETMGVQWKSSFPPAEYCGLLSRAAALPTAANSAGIIKPDNNKEHIEISENIIRSGEIFEKALYSLHPLSAAEEKEFKKIVEDITG